MGMEAADPMRTPRARNASFDHARRYAVIAGQLFRGRESFGPAELAATADFIGPRGSACRSWQARAWPPPKYRWAQGQYDRLPTLAANLVRRQVTVIAACATSAPGLAAKAATSAIPIVFQTGGDPIQDGLVTSMNRPGRNVTGVSRLSVTLEPKRL